jgi:hypothetical protein
MFRRKRETLLLRFSQVAQSSVTLVEQNPEGQLQAISNALLELSIRVAQRLGSRWGGGST